MPLPSVLRRIGNGGTGTGSERELAKLREGQTDVMWPRYMPRCVFYRFVSFFSVSSSGLLIHGKKGVPPSLLLFVSASPFILTTPPVPQRRGPTPRVCIPTHVSIHYPREGGTTFLCLYCSVLCLCPTLSGRSTENGSLAFAIYQML